MSDATSPYDRMAQAGFSRLAIARTSGVGYKKLSEGRPLTLDEADRVKRAIVNLTEARRLSQPIGQYRQESVA